VTLFGRQARISITCLSAFLQVSFGRRWGLRDGVNGAWAPRAKA
jgi:hypothetical protein